VRCNVKSVTIFGPNRNEITGKWSKPHNEELSDMYTLIQNCSGDKIENNEVGGTCSVYREGERRVQCFGRET
jgi:hypothetical protein